MRKVQIMIGFMVALPSAGVAKALEIAACSRQAGVNIGTGLRPNRQREVL